MFPWQSISVNYSVVQTILSSNLTELENALHASFHLKLSIGPSIEQ